MHEISQQLGEETKVEIINIESDVNSFFNLDPSENDNDGNGFTTIKSKDSNYNVSNLRWPFDNNFQDENNNSMQIPSELYSPTSISRSTTPESNYDYDFDSSAELFKGPVNEFDKKIALKVHQKEDLENTLLIYQTSQGNNHLSQSQKSNIIENDAIAPEIFADVPLVPVPLVDPPIGIKRRVEEEDEDSDYSPSKKRKGKKGNCQQNTNVKRINNREAAKRYRNKKKNEYDTDKMVKERLQEKNRELRKTLKERISTRKVLISLLKENGRESNKPMILPSYDID